MASIAHASEEFRNYVFWTVTAPEADYYWVGDAPRLSSRDEAASYALNDRGSGDTVIVAGVTLVPFTLSGDATVSVQARVRGGVGPYPFQVFVADAAGAGVLASGEVSGTGTWETFAATLAYADMATEGLHLAAAAGELSVAAFGSVGVGADGYDVSWIDFSTGRVPTRVYPRADGLGMGAPRLMDGRSPYRSPRVFGQI